MATRPHVGTLGEKHLHAELKRRYAEDGDLIEQPVDGYVVDLVRDDELIEIQTRGFSSMKRKLGSLLEEHQVRLVHPIAAEKWIVKIDDDGVIVSRRRSPKRGTVVDLFAELVSFPQLVAHEGLTLEIVLAREDEIWRYDGERGWRRRGWVVEERHLLEIVDRIVIDTPGALASLLPEGLPAEFTTADLARGLGRPRRLAQQMAYCLRHVGVIAEVDRRGNTIVYAAQPRSSG